MATKVGNAHKQHRSTANAGKYKNQLQRTTRNKNNQRLARIKRADRRKTLDIPNGIERTIARRRAARKLARQIKRGITITAS